MVVTTLAHEIEYHRLHLVQDEEAALSTWAERFDHAWDARLVDRCRQLLSAMKSNSWNLSPRSQGTFLRCRALLEMLLAENERAEVDYRRSLKLFRDANDGFLAGRVLNDLGTLFQAQSKWDDSIDCYRQALEQMVPERPDSPEEAMVRNNLGLALISLGDHATGVEELSRAGQLYRRWGMVRGEVQVQVNLAQLYRRQGQMAQALDAYRNALPVVRTHGDRSLEIDVLNSLGVVHRYLGQLDQAIDYYTQSLALAQTLDDLGGQAQALGNVGTIYQLQSKLAQARTCYEQALLLYETIPDLAGQARMWGNLGHMHSFDDQEDEALTYYARSLALYRQCGDRAGEGSALVNVAGSYRARSQYAEADALYQQALALGRSLGDARLQDSALGALGGLRIFQQHWEDAEALLQEALQLQREREDVYAQVETIYKLGMLANERGETADLVQILQPAWELAQAEGYVRWLTAIAWLLGDAAFNEGRFEAFNYYALAVAVALQYEDQRRYEKGLSILVDHINTLVQAGRSVEAHVLCTHLVDFWQSEDLVEWTQSAVSVIQQKMETLPDRLPL